MKHRALFGAILCLAMVLGISGGILTARVSVQSVYAQSGSVDPNPLNELQRAGNSSGAVVGGEPQDPREIAFTIIGSLFTVIGTVLMILVLYAGYLWWSARGNDDQVTKAKATLRNAIIGLIVLMASYGLLTFVFRSVFKPVNTFRDGGIVGDQIINQNFQGEKRSDGNTIPNLKPKVE